MVKVEYVDSTSITVTWAAPLVSRQNGQILGYRVLFSETKGTPSSSDPWSVMAVVPASEMTYTARGLRKWMFYNVQVLAYTAKGDGPLSDVVLVQTAEDGKINSSAADRRCWFAILMQEKTIKLTGSTEIKAFYWQNVFSFSCLLTIYFCNFFTICLATNLLMCTFIWSAAKVED